MSLSSVLKFFLIFFVYYLSAKLGLLFNVPPGYTTTFWPGAGVAFIALILFGYSYWSSIFLGAILFLFVDTVDLLQNLSLIEEITIKLILALSAAIQAVLGAYFVRKVFEDNINLVSPRDIIKFSILAGPITCLFSPTLGITLLIGYHQIEVEDALRQFFIWWLGQCFGVFFISPVILALLGTPRKIWRRRRRLILWPMLVVFIALIIGFNFFKQLEVSRLKSTFKKQVESIHQLLEREVTHHVDVLFSLNSFYSGSEDVERKEFKDFTRHYLKKFSSVKSLSWIPYVSLDSREAFEEKIKQETNFSKFYIYHINHNLDKAIAPKKEQYLPIDYIEPFNGNEGMVGYDISSEESYLDVLMKARDQNAPMAASLDQGQMPFDKQYLSVFFPIYNQSAASSLDSRRKNLKGFVMGEFYVNEIIKSVIEKFDTKKFILEAFDITRLKPTDLTRRNSLVINQRSKDKKIFQDYGKLKVSKFFNVVSRKWEVNYSPTDAYIKEEQSWNLWFVLMGAVGFTSMISIFMLMISGRTTEVEEQVSEKTEELKNRQERFDLALQGSSDGLWDWFNLEKDQQWWSPRFYELIGYKDNEIRATETSFMGLIHPEDREKVIDARRNHFEKDDDYKVEIRILHKTGQYRWCRVQGKGYRNERNQFVRMAGSLEDITDKKNTELALIEECKKTADLAATTQSAMKLKEEFLANVTHEIRSPMNSILGFADLLAKTPLDEKQQNYLETIQTSGNTLVDMINDLFDFSRMEKGFIRLELIEFDLEYLVNNLMHSASLKLKELPISAYSEIDINVPRKLVGDATRIRQVIMQLLNNAIKFTRQGEIVVHVSLAQETVQEDVTLRFSVKDTGVGIPSEKQKEVFESFAYAERSHTRESEGLGIGLAVCKKMIEKMGGEISVQSERGKGSEFVFTLKLKKSQMPSVSINWLMKEELKGKKVFILDNNRKSQEIIFQHCRNMGLTILGTAELAKGALNRIDELTQAGQIPEVIICEMMMSGMEVGDFVKKIKSQSLCRSAKLVCVTSNAQPGAAKIVQELGFDAYLSKPVSRQDLENIIRVLLNQETAEGLFLTRHLVKEMSCQGLRVLVAEDKASDRELIKAFLDNLECEAEFVQSGKDVIKKLQEKSFDLCLMDAYMPEMDGFEATQIIRKKISKDIPIIAISAYVTKDEQEKCLQAGMTFFLSKPIDLNQLRIAMLHYCRKKA